MASIHIVVGSVMGTALQVANNAHARLTAAGHSVRLFERHQPDIFQENTALLVCTSSTGMGDLPQNIVPFHLALVNDLPRIAGTPYGVISLGDSSYPNFAQAGHTLDEALADIGAQRLGEVLVLDALEVEDYDTAANDWLDNWQAQLQS